ncbi:protein sel-1 homolog 1-like isoform X2 [Scylla paramamosain]|uniref:protein sel-1 homolog 1-like isoform X2 n=1 Tax=Scylla paramamosain TaxID=85552 RepID=UPI003083CC04
MEMKERHRRGSVSGGGGAGGAGFLEGEEAPLLPGGLRNRRRRDSQPRYEPTDWDDSLPYGGKVYLARRKLPDSRLCVALQVAVVAASLGTLYYAWFHSDHMHFHLVKAYAHLGHREAQATVGHKLLHGKGVEQNHTAAMEWFSKAAEQGHPQASYNLAVGHLQGHTTQLKPGEAHKLIRHAASHGVPEAEEVMKRVCSKGHCDE